MTRRKKGFLLTFEGGEGTGKTTQIKKLDFLLPADRHIIYTREPGGTQLGEDIRRLTQEKQIKSSYAETLLFYAQRMEHNEIIIKPALEAKRVVVCDRYIDSTWAYQLKNYQDKEDGHKIAFLEELDSVIPDLTILFDIHPRIGLRRAIKRGIWNCYDEKPYAYHNKVRKAYLERAEQFPSRIKVIEVKNLNPDQIFEQVKKTLKKFGDRRLSK